MKSESGYERKKLYACLDAIDPAKRIAGLQVGNASELVLLDLSDRGSEEPNVHEALRAFHVRGEWFDVAFYVMMFGLDGTIDRLGRLPTASGQGWIPGHSGNPRGRPLKGNSIAEIVRSGTDPRAIVEAAVNLMNDETAPAKDRLDVIKWIANRGYPAT